MCSSLISAWNRRASCTHQQGVGEVRQIWHQDAHQGTNHNEHRAHPEHNHRPISYQLCVTGNERCLNMSKQKQTTEKRKQTLEMFLLHALSRRRCCSERDKVGGLKGFSLQVHRDTTPLYSSDDSQLRNDGSKKQWWMDDEWTEEEEEMVLQTRSKMEKCFWQLLPFRESKRPRRAEKQEGDQSVYMLK